MKQIIFYILLLVPLLIYSQDTIYKYNGTILIDNHNYKDSVISFGYKIDKLLKTEERSKNKIRKLVIKSFGVNYDTALAREGRYQYTRQGIDIIPDYSEKLNFMEIYLSAQNSKEAINNYPIQKLTDQEVIRLLGKPYQIDSWDCGVFAFIYLIGKMKILFYFYETCDCGKKPPCNEMVEKIEIFYNKNGAEL